MKLYSSISPYTQFYHEFMNEGSRQLRFQFTNIVFIHILISAKLKENNYNE